METERKEKEGKNLSGNNRTKDNIQIHKKPLKVHKGHHYNNGKNTQINNSLKKRLKWPLTYEIYSKKKCKLKHWHIFNLWHWWKLKSKTHSFGEAWENMYSHRLMIETETGRTYLKANLVISNKNYICVHLLTQSFHFSEDKPSEYLCSMFSL